MSANKYIQEFREILGDPPLTNIQELVLRMCWQGYTYSQIATKAKYEESYIRDIGAKLWQRLSNKLEIKISKKNLQVALDIYLYKRKKSSIKILSNTTFDSNYSGLNIKAGNLHSLRFPDGVVSLNSSCYISRPPCEQLAFQHVKNPGSILRIKAPKKMGKTSLLIRIIDYVEQQNYQTIYLDFKHVDRVMLHDIDQFLRWICKNISYQLNLPPRLDDFWDLELGSKVSCTLYLQNYILKQFTTPILLALNDVDELFEYHQITQDFFPLLRFWHEQNHHRSIWQKLRLVMTYSTENHVSLNVNQSPFNLGLVLKLPLLTITQVKNIAANYRLNRYSTGCESSNYGREIYEMTGGHPYLVRLALYHLSSGNNNLQELLAAAPTEEGIYRNYLHSLVGLIKENSNLEMALMKLASAKSHLKIDSDIAYQLENLGLIKRQGNLVMLNCQLYQIYFRDFYLANTDSD